MFLPALTPQFAVQRASPSCSVVLLLLVFPRCRACSHETNLNHIKKQWTSRACEADGIRCEIIECQAEDLETQLDALNADPTVHGIMIYYPVFGAFPSFYGGSMDDYLRDSISHTKDVEGLCFLYRRNLYHDVRFVDEAQTQKCILPCTPLACVKILEGLGAYDSGLPVGRRLSGKVVTVINRSEIVGRPLAAMLANDGATIYSIDIDSIFIFVKGKLQHCDETPESAVRKSDIVVAGVPSKAYKLPTEWIRPGAFVLNVATYKNVDEAALLEVPGVRYVPMVGKVTVAMLERNLLRLHSNFAAAAVDAAAAREAALVAAAALVTPRPKLAREAAALAAAAGSVTAVR
ncbi:unnamed protein product [Phaeothamnion confervicola]